MTDKTPAEHVETLRAWLAHPFSILLSRDELIAALTYAIERLSAPSPEPVAASREEIGSTKKTMTLNLTDEEMAALDELAAKQDLSKDRIFRQALKVYQLHVLDPELLAKLPSVQAGVAIQPITSAGARIEATLENVGRNAATKPPLEGGWKPADSSTMGAQPEASASPSEEGSR